MGEWLQAYIEQLEELWEKLNRRARIVILICVILVISGLIFLITRGGSPGYEPLFTRLNARDADAIVNRLEEEGVSYRIEDGGSTILVPGNRVHETRLDMAGQGLPDQGVVGFEIFDESQFGTTDFERRVNYYRALGGELSRSIQTMRAIDFAKVQVSAPEESLFVEEEEPAKASVLLEIKPGQRLSQTQVKAIGNLVASSVQNLNFENVTIVDTAGNLLSQDVSGAEDMYSGQLTMNQFEIRSKFEQGLRRDLKSMLTRVLGPNNFTVQVNAKLNFDRREVESKTYSPVVDEEGIVRSEQNLQENYEGTGAVPGGAPGTEENIPQYQAGDENQGQSTYEKSDTVTNYEINEKIERHRYASGEVERLSVAVMVNGAVEEETVDKIRNSVQAAIGYNPERGDVVTVTGLSFDEGLEEEIAAARQAAAAARRRRLYLYGGLILSVVVILFIIFMILRRAGEREAAPGQAVDYRVGEEIGEMEKEAAATELSEEEKERRKMKEEMEDLVTDQPEEVAQLLKSWLME